MGQSIKVQSDSDWAGDKVTRKSTSGGTIRVGSHLIKSWAKDQTVVATSSGEAELYGLNKAASEALGIKAIAADLGLAYDIDLEVDANATLGIVTRSGMGKMRHLDVAELWLQEAIKLRRFRVHKVQGKNNTADILTKHVEAELLSRHMVELDFSISQN
eukprot:7100360-Karenia_brevis.AAC.1